VDVVVRRTAVARGAAARCVVVTATATLVDVVVDADVDVVDVAASRISCADRVCSLRPHAATASAATNKPATTRTLTSQG
jgi:hypothetical protein